MNAVLQYIWNRTRAVCRRSFASICASPASRPSPSIAPTWRPARIGLSNIAAKSAWRRAFARRPAIPSWWPRPRARASRITWSMAITTSSRRSRLSFGKARPSSRALEGRSLFARGACDNKGQNLAHFNAVEAYLKTNTELPCDLTFVIEGEEEVGSKNLESFLAAPTARNWPAAPWSFPTPACPDLQHPGADLRLARHLRLRNHAARAVARFAFRHLWRHGGQSGHGPVPDAGPIARQKRARQHSRLLRRRGQAFRLRTQAGGAHSR